MGDCGRGRAGGLHGSAGHHHRQCRAALHSGRPRRQRGRGVLGGDDLSRVQRRHRHRDQLSRQKIRPQEFLPRLPRAVHAEFDPVRLCLESPVAAAVPPDAGRCGRRHGAGGAIDPRRFLPAGKTRPGLRAVWHRGGGRARRRPDARRLAVRQRLLALVFPDQRAGRPVRHGAHLHAGAGAQARGAGCASRST